MNGSPKATKGNILIGVHDVTLLKDKGFSNVHASFHRTFQKDMNRIRTGGKTASDEASQVDTSVSLLIINIIE